MEPLQQKLAHLGSSFFWQRSIKVLCPLILSGGLAWSSTAKARDSPDPGPVRVAIDHSYPPHQFADERGVASGFDVDLFRAVAERAGISYELELASWQEILEGPIDGSVDVNPGVFKTDQRNRHLVFSAPTLCLHHTVFVHEESSVAAPEDLRGATVLLTRCGMHHDQHEETPYPIVPVLAEDAGVRCIV